MNSRPAWVLVLGWLAACAADRSEAVPDPADAAADCVTFGSNTTCGAVVADLDCSQQDPPQGQDESCGFAGGRVETCVLTAIAQRRPVRFSHHAPGPDSGTGTFRSYGVSPSGGSWLNERAVSRACTETTVHAAEAVKLDGCATMRCVLAALESAPIGLVCIDGLVVCDE